MKVGQEVTIEAGDFNWLDNLRNKRGIIYAIRLPFVMLSIDGIVGLRSVLEDYIQVMPTAEEIAQRFIMSK